MSTNYNFSITKGCSFIQYLSPVDDFGVAINLSGYSFRGNVKNYYSDTGYIYSLNGITVPQSGILIISGSSISTSGLLCGSFIYDSELYTGDYCTKAFFGNFDIYSTTTNF